MALDQTCPTLIAEWINFMNSYYGTSCLSWNRHPQASCERRRCSAR